MNLQTEEVLSVEDRIKVADRVTEVIKELNECEIERLKAQGYTNTAFFNQDGSLTDSYKWRIKEKAKYFYLNCGTSGAFMVDRITGEIYNIKAYGQIDKNKKIKADLGNIKNCNSEILHSKRYNYLR